MNLLRGYLVVKVLTVREPTCFMRGTSVLGFDPVQQYTFGGQMLSLLGANLANIT